VDEIKLSGIECLNANVNSATVLGSILTSSENVESEGQQLNKIHN